MNPPPRSPRFVGNRRPRATRLKDRLDAGALKGTFQELGTPAVTELLGLAGADFVVIDGEHGTFSIDRLEDYVRAGSSSGTAVLYRAASSSDQLARALDTGIAGIVVPRVESGAQAHAVVDAVRFPPVGSRGLGPGRTSGYGVALDELRTSGNDEVLVVAMVETKAGLGAVDEIAQTPGIDAIMIGPADLASSLNVDSGSPAPPKPSSGSGMSPSQRVFTPASTAPTPGTSSVAPTRDTGCFPPASMPPCSSPQPHRCSFSVRRRWPEGLIRPRG